VELLTKLKTAVSSLISKVITKAKELKYSDEQTSEAVAKIYVR
jgi:hypothetical protein